MTTTPNVTLIRELINIPDSVRRGDFVLRLTEGVVDAEKTLREYVVTPQLVTAFERSLSLIKASIDARSSKGSYLHGSFGSGKSHFMAVMHLLLQGNMHARSMVELAPVIAKHNSWLVGQNGQGAKKCLLVPFNMIGARSMESAILGQYSEYVGKLHPEKPLPGVYLAEKVFENADQLRRSMGDAKFFETLNAGTGGGGAGGWGDLSAGWDSGSYEKARKAPPKAAERARLVSDLVAKLLPAFRTVAQGSDSGESYVDLDTGLSILSKHAQSLGYNALILFLDEMILWLASRAGDQSFLSREGQKLAKLVESANPDRPVPIVSFIARQRDLRELVGTHVPGAEQLAFGDVLKWWEGRFDTITLEDRNLPAIAKKRVLAPVDDAAKIRIDAAFAETKKIREDMRNILLTSKYNDEVFRDVYPFSPALIDTLVAISSVLQRERTALKVMLELLVKQRDSLELGQLVPVGDLYDLIAQGDEAVTEGMRRHYEQANRLYQGKLLPLLEQKHGPLEKIEQLPWNDPKRAAFRNQDRIAKTLLLAALAPEVESLKGLTPLKVAALNHGSIKSPIPGREAQEVLRMLREWAAVVGELKIGDDSQNPSVVLQLTGVDTESILEKARHEDNISILFDDQGLLWFGQRGERELSYRAFSELLSVFTTEPLLRAMHGSQDIGLLHPLSLSQTSAGPRVVLLSGRSWHVQLVDWRRGIVNVAPAAELGRSLWRGGSAVLSQPMCSSIRNVLVGDSTPMEWSKRAAEEMRVIRTEHEFLQRTSLQVGDDGEATWWTFAGLRANSQLSCALEETSGLVCTPSNLSVGIQGIPKRCDIDAVLDRPAPLPLPRATMDQYLQSVKFIEYLPDSLQAELIISRLQDNDAIGVLRGAWCDRAAKT